MSHASRILALSVFAEFSLVSLLSGQAFTRITTGSLVNDGGASRSVNWVDYDNDGNLDLFVSNGKEGGENNFLYKNDGPAMGYTFTKIVVSPIVSDNMPSDGTSWGDYNNDGFEDCFVVNWYNFNNMLFANNAGASFSRITVGPPVTNGGYSESCTWGDYDNDGNLDLYVANSGFNSASGPTPNFLYHNNGDGTFTRVLSGDIIADVDFSRCANWVDYDNDGDLDMFVANERNYNNRLYRNMLKETGAISWAKVTTGSIVSDGGSSWTSSWADYDNDGDQDVFVGNSWPFPGVNFLYKNNGDRTFTKATNDTIVGSVGYHASSAWGDFDNDGDLDMFVTTAYGTSASRNILYRNRLMKTGTASFERIGTGSIVTDLGYSYGCSWGDYDNDGDLDMFVAKTLNEAENNALYRNENANGNHSIQIRCKGVISNRSGIGTKVKLRATINGTAVWQMREVAGVSGLCGQNLMSHFGLGDATIIDTLNIEWPAGSVEIRTNVPVDTILTLVEGTATDIDGENAHGLPGGYILEQNYPNPFNPSTTIRFSLPARSHVNLSIVDILGRHITTLVDEDREAGRHSVDFSGSGVASGVYVYTLLAGGYRQERRLLLLK